MSGEVRVVDESGKPIGIDSQTRGLKVYLAGDYRGAYPESYYVNGTSATGTNAGDVLVTSPDVSSYNVFSFQGVANLFTLEVSLDGTNWSGAQAMQDMAATASTTFVAASANTTSIYVFRGKIKQFRLKQSGASAAQARYAYGVA